jgi:hypothetical protein
LSGSTATLMVTADKTEVKTIVTISSKSHFFIIPPTIRAELQYFFLFFHLGHLCQVK